MKGFTDFSEAFDFCREADHPVNVIVGNHYKLFPSGVANLIGEPVFTETEYIDFTENETPEEPPWVTEFSQLCLDEVMNMTRDDVARDLPPETVAFFL